MCGIIGIYRTEDRSLKADLLKGLYALEYRGYDSAGIAVLENSKINIYKTVGEVSHLETSLQDINFSGRAAIGHTRWATHGEPSSINAHPHGNQRVAVVHNGIIENFAAIKASLIQKGERFISQTDSEVIFCLIESYLKEDKAPLEIIKILRNELKGRFAILVLFANGDIYGLSNGCPMLFGTAQDEFLLASDPLAILDKVNGKVCFLEDKNILALSNGKLSLFDAEDTLITPKYTIISVNEYNTNLGSYKHFMHKEIHEQPKIINGLCEILKYEKIPLTKPKRILILGCGSSFYAGMIARYWFEEAGIATQVEVASEFRDSGSVIEDVDLCLFISQSGETADVIAAYESVIKTNPKIKTVGILNVVTSTLGRLVDLVLPIYAFAEIGVASTKALTAQLVVLYNLASHFANKEGIWNFKDEILNCYNTILSEEKKVAVIAHKIIQSKALIFIGRGINYPLALEGALKIKELAYINASGYLGGELKHGPIALIEPQVTVISLITFGPLMAKMLSNTQEILARGADVIFMTDAKSKQYIVSELGELNKKCTFITIDSLSECSLMPLVMLLPLQLIAYYAALLKECSIDKPRNLAKSVTVE